MKRAFALLLALVMVLALAACGGKTAPTATPAAPSAAPSSSTAAPATAQPTEAAPVEKIVMRLGTEYADPNAHPSGAGVLAFCDKMTEILGEDRIQIDRYHGGQLGTTAEDILGGVLIGSAEIMDYNLGSYATYTTAFTPMEAPYLFLGRDEVFAFLDGEAGQVMKDQAIADAGLHVLYYSDNGFRQLTNSKHAVHSPDDMKGLKIRVMSNPVYIALMDSFGALPTPMSFSELYTALQQGVVDGQENPIATIYENKLYEIQKYLTLTNHVYGCSSLVMSEDYYQSLPDDVRAAVIEASAAGQQATRDSLSSRESKQLEEIGQQLEVYDPTAEERAAFQASAKTVWDKVAELSNKEYFDKITGYAG
jgi:tripartite ATP-independent transporter DctP family solute receptor